MHEDWECMLRRRRNSSDSLERSQSPFPGPAGPAAGLRGMVSSAVHRRRGQAANAPPSEAQAAAERCVTVLRQVCLTLCEQLRALVHPGARGRVCCTREAYHIALVHAGTKHGRRLWAYHIFSWGDSQTAPGER